MNSLGKPKSPSGRNWSAAIEQVVPFDGIQWLGTTKNIDFHPLRGYQHFYGIRVRSRCPALICISIPGLRGVFAVFSGSRTCIYVDISGRIDKYTVSLR